MKRDLSSAVGLSSTAGLFALLAFVIHTVTISPEGVSGSGDSAQGKKSSLQAKTTGSEVVMGLEGPWTATRAFFNNEPAADQITPEKIESLLSAEGLLPGDYKIWRKYLGLRTPADGEPDFRKWAIVATVADPAHSRFQLFFDEQIASIKLAAANQDWEFAAQWLPWRDGPETSSGGIEEKRRERQLERDQEALPGILIFRRWGPKTKPLPEVLFVLVVGEIPTRGIAGDAFYAALNLASVLSSEEDKIGLLAPTFSGSFESLTRHVKAWDSKHPELLHRHVYGGSISSSEYADAFREVTGFDFSSGIANSKNYKTAFEDLLLPRYHVEDKAAYWVEDESGFSASFQRAVWKKKVPIYTFPREISHLRNAYQEATQGTRNTVRNVVPRLDFSLKDPSHGEDSIPVFSDTHTPVAQSAAISTVTEEFRREGIQIVFIAASNTLDSLLLARFVRNESPNTKVVIGDADLLFIPAASQDSLNGTLFLSTYPMFILGDEWLTRDADGNDGEKERHFAFPGATQQGIFNVTQQLLADLNADIKNNDDSKTRRRDDLHGYRQLSASPPSNEQEYPGLWLLELTHYGFLPVDWFPVSNENCWFAPSRPVPVQARTDQCPTSADSSSSSISKTDLEERFPLDEPSHGWYIAAIGMSIAIFVGCCLLFKQRDSFAVDRRFPALLGACLSATAAQGVLLLPAWRVLSRTDDPSLQSWIILVVTLWAPVALWLTFSYLFFRSKGQGRKESDPLLCRVYAAVIFAVFVLLSAQWLESCGFFGATDPQILLFRLRALELFAEGSPALPLFIFSLIFSIGFLLYLWRYTLGPESTPRLAEADGTINAINAAIHAPFGLEKKSLFWRLGICALLVLLAMLNLWDGLRAFEVGPYNCALYIAVALMLLSIATGSWDLLRTWFNLSAFLNWLQSEPSLGKEAFERVTRQWPRQRVFAPWRSVPDIPVHLDRPAEQGSVSPELSCCRYIVYAARQTQRIAWTVSLALLSLIGVLTTYSPQAPQHIGRFLAVLFLVIGGIMIWVFSAMEKNWILSRIEGTEPSALNFEFWINATAVAALPLAGVLIHLFPSIGSFVSSWLAPSLEALR